MYNDNFLVTIPIYNEESIIPYLCESINSYFLNENSIFFLIINDGSTDNTIKLLNQYKINNSALVSNNCRKGISYCMNSGFEYAKENNFNNFVLYPGNYRIGVDSLLKAISNFRGENYLMIGNRFILDGTSQNLPFFRKLGTKILNVSIKKIYKLEISDITCGLRLLKVKDWDNFDKLVPDKYGYSGEQIIILKALHNNIQIKEISVNVTYDKRRMYSHFLPVNYSEVILPWVKYKLWLNYKIDFLKPTWV